MAVAGMLMLPSSELSQEGWVLVSKEASKAMGVGTVSVLVTEVLQELSVICTL